MPQHDIVVIGASAGGLQALTTLVERLPPRLAAYLFVVMHTRAEADGVLPQILGRVGRLPVTFAVNGMKPARGHVYIAPPDEHLTLGPTGMRVLRGPRENGFRPAIDPLFRTAARAYGPRVVGIVLSGALDDGTYGLSVIKHEGGIAIVQDPADALVSSMPASAIRNVEVDYVQPAAGIADMIARLSSEPVGGGHAMARRKDFEPQLPAAHTAVETMEDHYGEPSALTCPDCGGALWEIKDGNLLRYQCHVGHLYSPESLQAEQRDAVDGALWTAVRVLEEHAELKIRMAKRAAAGGLPAVSRGFEESARDAHQQAQQLRALLFASGSSGNGDDAGAVIEAVAAATVAAADFPRHAARSRPAAKGKAARRSKETKRQL